MQLLSVPRELQGLLLLTQLWKHRYLLALVCPVCTFGDYPHLCQSIPQLPPFQEVHTLCFSCPFWSSISKSAEGMGKKDTEPFHGVYIPPQIFQMKNVYSLEENLPLGW